MLHGCLQDGERLLYNAYISSYLFYCATFWGMAPRTNLKRLFALQKRAFHALSPPGSPPNRMEDLEILPLPLALTYCICIFIRQQFSGCGPKVLSFQILGTQRLTRAQNNKIIKIERRKTKIGRDSLYVKAVRVSNCLPIEIRTIDSRNLFKRKLKRLLLRNENKRLNFF